jgi:hypothetical protein
MQARFIRKGLRTPAQIGHLADEQFFTDHPRREFHIRKPVLSTTEGYASEFEQEFLSLGDHDVKRRRIIVKRVEPAKARQFGVKFMPIPFLLFADESLRDDDETLRPIFDTIMKNAAADYGVPSA